MGKINKREIADNLSCIILAAGGGTRLKPVSLKIPKALSPIVDKPIIEQILEGFHRLGIRHFVIVVKSKKDPIKQFFLEKKVKADIRFSYQTEALGSGHALKMTEGVIKTNGFFVSACDNIVPFTHLHDMLNKFQEEKCKAVLSLQHESIEGLFARSNVSFQENRVVKIIEKPSREEIMSDIMSLPLYCCRQDVFTYLRKLTLSPRGEYELPQIFQMMIDDGKNICGVFTDRRFDLTTPADLLAINWAFLKKQAEGIRSYSNMPEGLNLVPPIFIDSGCSFGKNCSLGPCVVIGKNCTISSAVTLNKCVVLEGTQVPNGENATNRVLFNQ